MQRMMGVALCAGSVLAAAGALSLLRTRSAPIARLGAALPASSRKQNHGPGAVTDPLLPARPMMLDPSRTEGEHWVSARPAFQYSHSAAERGGVEPCAVPVGDSSAFSEWVPLSRGHFSAPRSLQLDTGNHFNLVIHLHGDDPARRELLESRQSLVLYALTLPISQSYAPLFAGSHFVQQISAEVAQALSKREGKPVSVGKIAMSAWSAGFVGVEAALSQPDAEDISAVLLIDGLHAPRGDDSAFKAQLKPFLDYATLAAADQRFFFVSHSSIDPPDFASTTECAHYLIASLGGTPEPVTRADPLGLELKESFSRGGFHVRGYAGNDKADHCAELGTLRDAFAALGHRWGAASVSGTTATPNSAED